MKKPDIEIEQMKLKYPNMPEHALPTTRTKKTPANELAFQIVNHVKSLNGQCYRQNSQGQYDSKLGMWRKSGSTKGLADLQAIILGRFIAIEVKIGKDRQSDVQKLREGEIKQSGGYYIIAKEFETFKKDLETILNEIKK